MGITTSSALKTKPIFFNTLSKRTNYENVQNGNFTTCPKTFLFLSASPSNLALTLHRQREQTTTTNPEDDKQKFQNKIH